MEKGAVFQELIEVYIMDAMGTIIMRPVQADQQQERIIASQSGQTHPTGSKQLAGLRHEILIADFDNWLPAQCDISCAAEILTKKWLCENDY